MAEQNVVEKKIIEFATETFPDYPELHSAWKADLKNINELNHDDFQPCQSLKAFLVIINQLSTEHLLNLQDIEDWIHTYSHEIRDFVIPYIHIEQSSNFVSSNQNIVSELLNQSFIESGSALIYHKLRDTISKNEFQMKTEFPTALINEKTLTATAQVRSDGNAPQQQLSSGEIEQWKNLTAQAITSMDDLTADIFDIISILWMRQATHKDQMINFHTDDALNLRHVQGRTSVEGGYQSGYRKKERDDIMRRLAALTTIWIRIERDKLKFVDADSNDFEELEQVQFNPLFLIDSVTVAYRNEQPVGIYECKIRPGELLANFLYGSKRSSGLLALKTLQYNPVKQKYHKRLARYLSWQWRIRQKGADYFRPYSIGGEKGLLNVMGIEENARYGTRIKEQFETILDTLQQDGIIKNWNYLEHFNESFIESDKRWFQNHWLQAKVQIVPPKEITIQNNKEHLSLNEQQEMNFAAMLKNMTEAENEVAVTIKSELEVTPDNMKRTRTSRDMKLAEVAKEIGISHTTLSRYENGKILSPTGENMAKMKKWLNGEK